MRFGIAGIGVSAPGIPDWKAAHAVMLGEAPYEEAPVEFKPPEILSGAERRRSPDSVRLALDIAEQARLASGLEGRELAAVFGSMSGDGPVVSRCLEHLSETPRYVSPTDFHNSVHNAAVGYWAIGAGSHRGATSLGASQETFPAALLKAALEVEYSRLPVLLCVYDIPHPPPLYDQVPVTTAFGAAFVLTPPETAGAVAQAELEVGSEAMPVARPGMEFWAGCFDCNPAARAIPVLERLAMPDGAAGDPICIGSFGGASLTVVLTS